MIYRNDHGTQLYPFIDPIPFPIGLIADIKICIKRAMSGTPFVSAISAGQQSLIVSLSYTDQQGINQGTLCTFVYADNLWITVDTDKVFGFLLLNHPPRQAFSYLGTWKLSRRCYTFGVTLGAYDIGAEQISAAQGNLLQVYTSGLLTERNRLERANIDGRIYDTVINIGRNSQDSHTQLVQARSGKLPYISTVNGVACSELFISSSDPTIQIESPIATGDSDVYVLYINTNNDFPHCSQWDLQSNSSSSAQGIIVL